MAWGDSIFAKLNACHASGMSNDLLEAFRQKTALLGSHVSVPIGSQKHRFFHHGFPLRTLECNVLKWKVSYHMWRLCRRGSRNRTHQKPHLNVLYGPFCERRKALDHALCPKTNLLHVCRQPLLLPINNKYKTPPRSTFSAPSQYFPPETGVRKKWERLYSMTRGNLDSP